MGINRHEILGNVGDDGELRETSSGPVLNFRVCVDETYTTKSGERKKSASWHSVVVWGKRATSLAPHITKGKLVYCAGPARTKSFEGRDGQKRYRTEINALDVELLGGGKSRPTTIGDVTVTDARDHPGDDIPF